MNVRKVWFENIHSSTTGGCINSNLSTLNGNVEQCHFYNCSSTAYAPSSSRDYNSCCGGAIFLDINRVILVSCIFVQCVGNGLGAAVYTCTPSNSKTIADCICDVRCGKSSTGHQSVYDFEQGAVNIKNLNSTNPIAKSTYGAIHFGMYPKGFTFDFISIVYSEKSINSVAFGVALGSSKKGYSSHVFVQNSTNVNGLFSLWRVY